MNNEQITGNMTVPELIMTMSQGNPGAVMIILKMINDSSKVLNLIILDTLDIRGTQLYMLHNDCCDRNDDKFERTLMMLKSGIFTDEEIKANLSQVRAIPFIDDEIVIEGVPSYEEDFGPMDEKWKEYCVAQKGAFEVKIAPVLEKQKGRSK